MNREQTTAYSSTKDALELQNVREAKQRLELLRLLERALLTSEELTRKQQLAQETALEAMAAADITENYWKEFQQALKDYRMRAPHGDLSVYSEQPQKEWSAGAIDEFTAAFRHAQR